jgi:hypothetical protein
MPSRVVLLLALVAAVLLVAAELSTVASVDVAGDSCQVINDSDPALAERCELSGWDRHGGALIFLALVIAGAGFLAGRRGGAAPAAVLAAVGLLVLGLALIGDLPKTNETGAIGRDFDGATAQAGLGFYLELLGGLLALLAGVLGLLAERTQRASPSASSPASPPTPAA